MKRIIYIYYLFSVFLLMSIEVHCKRKSSHYTESSDATLLPMNIILKLIVLVHLCPKRIHVEKPEIWGLSHTYV